MLIRFWKVSVALDLNEFDFFDIQRDCGFRLFPSHLQFCVPENRVLEYGFKDQKIQEIF